MVQYRWGWAVAVGVISAFICLFMIALHYFANEMAEKVALITGPLLVLLWAFGAGFNTRYTLIINKRQLGRITIMHTFDSFCWLIVQMGHSLSPLTGDSQTDTFSLGSRYFPLCSILQMLFLVYAKPFAQTRVMQRYM